MLAVGWHLQLCAVVYMDCRLLLLFVGVCRLLSGVWCPLCVKCHSVRDVCCGVNWLLLCVGWCVVCLFVAVCCCLLLLAVGRSLFVQGC